MNEIVKQEAQPVATTPMQMIEKAVAMGAPIEQMQALMDLQERWEAREAKKAYVEAMNAFKAEPVDLYKDKTVKAGQATYSHVSLEFASAMIGKALSKHGFSHRWETEQSDKGVKVSCIITHELGHSERTTLEAGADTSGSKNSVQAIGSTVTYLQRYTLLAITGIAVKGQGDDGMAINEISQDEFEEIQGLIDEAGVDARRFCEAFKINSVRSLLGKDYRKAKMQLKQRIKNMQKGQK